MKCEYSVKDCKEKMINDLVENYLLDLCKYIPESQEVLERGLLIIEKLQYNPDILILGFNPSYNSNHNFPEKYKFWNFWESEYKDKYDNFLNLMWLIQESIQKEIVIEYFDIFWIRETKGKKLIELIKNDKNLKNFIKDQFQISLEILKNIQPKIILGA